jgi:hypothetical protein
VAKLVTVTVSVGFSTRNDVLLDDKALFRPCGVQLITAVILAAELGDFAPFASARALMAYLGLVPSNPRPTAIT